MPKIYLVAAALFAGLAVAAGAFAAHGLKSLTTDEKVLGPFHTAAQYQMYHALALLAIAALYSRYHSALLKWSANCFIIGILLFSGSLYLITLLKIQGEKSIGFLGPITPIGGVFFLAGWLLLLISFLRQRSNQ